MTDANTFQLASKFDALPDDAIVTTKVAAVLLGGSLAEQTLRRNPPIPRRQISQRRFGFRVGDLRKLIRGELQPAAVNEISRPITVRRKGRKGRAPGGITVATAGHSRSQKIPELIDGDDARIRRYRSGSRYGAA